MRRLDCPAGWRLRHQLHHRSSRIGKRWPEWVRAIEDFLVRRSGVSVATDSEARPQLTSSLVQSRWLQRRAVASATSAEIEKALTSEGLMRSRRRLLLVDGLAGATPSLAPGELARIRPYAHPYYWAGFIYTGL